MKSFILILLIFPALNGFAQMEQEKTSTPIKPSTTACPTWNKKDKKASKAEYFQSLRTKKKVNQQAANNPYSYRDSRLQPAPIPQKTENQNRKISVKQTTEEINTEKAEIVEPKEIEKSSNVFSKKNKSANSSADDVHLNNKSEKSSPQMDEKPATSKVSSDEKTSVKNMPEEAKSNDAKTAVKDKKIEDSKLKKKLERMSRKTTKVRRHSNSKCPSF